MLGVRPYLEWSPCAGLLESVFSTVKLQADQCCTHLDVSCVVFSCFTSVETFVSQLDLVLYLFRTVCCKKNSCWSRYGLCRRAALAYEFLQ